MKSSLQNSFAGSFANAKALISLAIAFVCLALFCLALFCLVLIPGPVLCKEQKAGNAVGLSVSVDRDEAHVGETVELTLSFQLPEGATLTEDIKINGLDDLTVMEIKHEHGVIKIAILTDKLGSLKSGPIELIYHDDKGNEKGLKAEPVSINVLSNLGDKPAEAELRPIRDILPTSSALLKYLPWIIGMLVVLALAAAVFFIIKKRKAGKRKIESLIPAHQRARDSIDSLVQEGIFEKGDVKGFYFRFSEIIRFYMENIRYFPAAEYTTEEISRHISEEEDRKILPLLKNADLVKFADKVPSAHNKESDVKEALEYIVETSPRDVEA